ncbi:unnamed protein product [Caenorhabditis sp. 36 PRJEB53466]|nr:unnamed protein product [Caenorhabditis sp. 36 PRJEB53466]
MGDPLPFGSIELVTVPREPWAPYVLIESSVYPCILVSLISITLLTSLKVRKRRLFLVSSRAQKTTWSAEKTLLITTMLIILPILANQLFKFTDYFECPLHFFGIVRPLLQDARSHVVTCYFYWRHPMFKRKIELIRSSDKF